MNRMTIVAALAGAALAAGCGVETASTAATAAAGKQKELEEGRKTMEQAEKQIQQSMEQIQRAEKAADSTDK